MGAKQTKIEGSYLPDTPVTNCKTLHYLDVGSNADTGLDPRSPSGCRTPILLQSKPSNPDLQLSLSEMPERTHNNERTLDILRKRFLKSFNYNLNDPRSPSLNLNRTPLVFEDKSEKPLSLDDTFSNLFVESCLPNVLSEADQPEEVRKTECDQKSDGKENGEKMTVDSKENSMEQETVIALQQEFDPRSPSIGVERTPIIFTDDEIDESSEDVMLESILATLSLDMNSSGTSIVSSISQNKNGLSDIDNFKLSPVNKHLDRVRTGKKCLLKSKHLKPKRRTSHRKIYEDQENEMPLTPITTKRQNDKNVCMKGKRTPLICVRNRNDTHVRSRSVDSSAKSIKTRLVLTSFDDTLNPIEKYKSSNLRVMHKNPNDSLNLS